MDEKIYTKGDEALMFIGAAFVVCAVLLFPWLMQEEFSLPGLVALISIVMTLACFILYSNSMIRYKIVGKKYQLDCSKREDKKRWIETKD